MPDKPELKLVAQPQDYFRELVTEALGRQRLATQPETEFYLVNLLNRFMIAERLVEEPLALMVKEALEDETPRAQAAKFRHIGDTSLYVAGYFPESLSRKLVDVDYYIDIGCTAYRRVAEAAPATTLPRRASREEDALRAVYRELADKFSAFVEVLAHVSDQTTPRTEKDLLRLYELWMRTGSERARKALNDAGIIPNEMIKKKELQ